MLHSFRKKLHLCELKDVHSFSKRIRSLQKSKLTTLSGKAQVLADDLEKSINLCKVRADKIPKKIQYPPELPVSGKSKEIIRAILSNQVVILSGDTGSGKTTQLPKICLDAGFGRKGLIAHSQPRRLAATSVARRIAEELNSELGDLVGFKIRFNDHVKETSCIKLMTDGILLSEIQNDRYLTRYDVIIIDEAHERSLNIDFLLGFLKGLLKKRPDLKVIITSATIDVEKFSAHFDGAPIISVEGRTYPVETIYSPVIYEEEKGISLLDGILSNLRLICNKDAKNKIISGDILVFLSSEREIREAARAIRKINLRDTEVLPLYAKLRSAEQAKIFKSHSGRRVVLSTNVAETSITVPGIKYVIDSGLARISRYSTLTKVQRLPIEAISQASANQRKGRCGRLEDGICIRLYTENDFGSRPLFTDPEIKRTNLAAVILRMYALRLGNVDEFPFLECPERKAINEGFKLLIELNALTSKRELTNIGFQMATLPVDPKLATMLITANSLDCLKEVSIVVAMLSVQNPQEEATGRQKNASEKSDIFNNQDSDFMNFIQLWNEFEIKRLSYTHAQLKKYCKANHLSFIRMREWREVHNQLVLNCRKLGFKLNKKSGSYTAIHKSIIVGSLNQIAMKTEGTHYIGNRNKKFIISKSSVIAKNTPKWIVSGELIETSKTFASIAAKINPEWVLSMAPHLVKKEIFEPHWSKIKQRVQAYEKVRLYGLVIIERAVINFSDINQAEARSIFITEGLVRGALSTKAEFYINNQNLLLILEKEEEKLRRPEIIVSENEIVRFYEERIPGYVNSTAELEKWLMLAPEDDVNSLFMTRENLMISDSAKIRNEYYPNEVLINKNRLSIDYVFDPKSSKDGATIEVPIQIMNQITQQDIDWAVPGIIREKCITLLKGLPKKIRKKIIPISAFVDEILPQMSASNGDILSNLSTQLLAKKRIEIQRDELKNVDLPAHLVVKIQIRDISRNKYEVRNSIDEFTHKSYGVYEEVTNKVVMPQSHPIEKSNLLDWSFNELPERLEIGNEVILVRYPALVDNKSSVAIKLFADEQEAINHNNLGLVRLYMLKSIQQRNLLRKRFVRFEKENALIIPHHFSNIVNQAISASYMNAFNVIHETPRTRKEYLELLNNGKSKLYACGEDIVKVLVKIFRLRFDIIKDLGKSNDPRFGYFKEDIETQLDNLVDNELLLNINLERLKHFPRYLKAIMVRLGKFPHIGKNDLNYTQEIAKYWNKYSELIERKDPAKLDKLNSLRWMIEEYRVSLFAQYLGTEFPISAKRLDRQFELL